MRDIKNLLKFLTLSFIGIFAFFIPININGKVTIPIDHIVNFFRNNFTYQSRIFALVVIFIGAVYPFINGNWKKSKIEKFFSVAKIMGLIFGIFYFFNMGPDFLFKKDLLPFLYEKLVVPVGIIVPVGALFLSFLTDYGLLEFVGEIMKPVMRPIWKVPGRAAIDAIASFVGSYSIALLITNRVFKEGKYTIREASIIATGFSTVSATFMIIVAKTLGLMKIWNTFFWTTLLITFLVTAITVRIFPLSKKENSLYKSDLNQREYTEGNILKSAIRKALISAKNSGKVSSNIVSNLKDGFLMVFAILPSILFFGLLGLLLAKYTPIFNYVGYIFYPILYIFKVPNALIVSKASATEIAEMFLPSLIIKGHSQIPSFIVGVESISSILFFSASIPCIFATEIPITISEILIIWFERTIFSLILATIAALIIF